jgi:hypothetical protein
VNSYLGTTIDRVNGQLMLEVYTEC